MSYCAYVTRLENVRPHPNADRLMLADCFGNTTCVAKDLYYEGQLVVYFPTDGQLSEAFCEANNMVEKKDENGKNIGGYLHPRKRNIKAIRLRGAQSDGIALDIGCLEFTGANLKSFKPGDQITVVNGIEICKKYIPVGKEERDPGAGGRNQKRAKRNLAPLFFEHIDTAQLNYNLDMFNPGDHIQITRKLHGTSGRTAYTKVFKGFKHNNIFFQRVIDNCYNKPNLGKFAGFLLERALAGAIEVYDWDYVSGTRRTVLKHYEGGYYENNDFRRIWHTFFKGRLLKGETVYYEIVGFLPDGTPIMPSCDNHKLNDEEFLKQYGETTTFSYGCEPTGYEECECERVETGLATVFLGQAPIGNTEDIKMYKKAAQQKIFIYRMTMTNEDGDVIEYPPHLIAYRCKQMYIPMVPVEWEGFIPDDLPATNFSLNEEGHKEFVKDNSAGKWVKEKAEEFFDGPEPLDPRHLREGVVVRIINRKNFTAFKTKNFNFKVLEGIIKNEATEPDMEEAEEGL